MPKPPDAPHIFSQAMGDHLKVISSLQAQRPLLEQVAGRMTDAILRGKKVLWCGNGGSAADSQHLAAELVGRFRRERSGLASIALTTDASILTAVSNDYGFDAIFRRQVEALGNAGDILVAMSTSGNSKNVCSAIERAREMEVYTIAMTGAGGGLAGQLADCAVCVASQDTARIQEAHMLIGHIWCDWIEACVCHQSEPAQVETR